MSELRVLTESLGGSAFSKAARAGELPQWFVPVPRSSDEWRRHADGVITSVSADWFEKLGPAIAATGAAAERLKRSAGGNGIVITTGQQPGLFGGPLMTLVKALSARALADVLQDTLNMPVAPVFWAATDDADFDEAARVSLALDGGARELRLEETSPAGVPMARVPMGADVGQYATLLRDACGSAPAAEYLTEALAHYRPGATVGDAYVALLRHVLAPLEIAVLDVSHPSVARASDSVLRKAARRADAVAAAVTRRGQEIVAAGYTPQVDDVAGLSLVFVNEQGSKRRLMQTEAAAFDAAEDRWLSSTVLVRPVLERALLPTAAYMGGPGEVAYFAQVTAVADALDLARPLVLPRWSTTIIEPRIQRMLNELGVSHGDLADPHAVDGRLARARIPNELDAALRELRDALESGVDRVSRANNGLVPDKSIDAMRNALAHRLDRLERRVVARVKRRETDLMRAIGTARGALYPHGSRQERKLAWVPFLARYGAPLVDEMLQAARAHARGLVSGAPSLPASSASSAATAAHTARV